MIINTREFGHIEIDEKDIIHFPFGLYSFEDVKDYVILKNDEEESPVLWLQATHDVYPSFVILDSNFVVDEYDPKITDENLNQLGASSLNELRFFVIAVVADDIKDMTVNLKSPIVLNIEKNIAIQVILENPEYSVRHYIFEQDGMVK
jgi:flagellar assembly factor FliW